MNYFRIFLVFVAPAILSLSACGDPDAPQTPQRLDSKAPPTISERPERVGRLPGSRPRLVAVPERSLPPPSTVDLKTDIDDLDGDEAWVQPDHQVAPTSIPAGAPTHVLLPKGR